MFTQWLLAGGALPPLQAQLADRDADARAAAHTAVSCLVRRYPPAMDALLQVVFDPPAVSHHTIFTVMACQHGNPKTLKP